MTADILSVEEKEGIVLLTLNRPAVALSGVETQIPGGSVQTPATCAPLT